MVRIPPGFHPQAYRPGNRLSYGPGWRGTGARPAPRLPIGAYRSKASGVPLQPASAQCLVSSVITAVPQLVQAPSGAGTASPIAVTLAATTAGNKLIVAVALAQGTTRPQVSGITLGGGGTFTRAAQIHSATACDLELWESADANGITGGQTALSVAFTGGTGTNPGGVARPMEWSGLLVPSALDDEAATDSGANTSWNSPDVASAAAGEIVVGAVAPFLNGSATTITGPAAPWVNQAQASQGTIVSLLTGYQLLAAATPAIAYQGTLSGSKAWSAAAATFRPAQSGTAGNAQCILGPSGAGNIWYPTQVTLSTTTGITAGFDGSVASLYLGPVISPNTLLGTVIGGNGIVAAALPPIQPGQFLIAQWAGAVGGDTATMNVQGTMDALSF